MGRYDVRCPRTRALGRHEPEPLVCHQCWGGAPATCGRAPRDGPRPRVDVRGIDKRSKLTTLLFSPLRSLARRGRTDDRRACRGCGYSFNNASFHRSTQVSTALWAPRRHTYPGLRPFYLPLGRSRLRPRRTRLALGSLLSVPGPFLFRIDSFTVNFLNTFTKTPLISQVPE